MIGSAAFGSSCASCGPFFLMRLNDQPVWLYDGVSWLIGTGLYKEQTCRVCGKVHERRLHTFNAEDQRGWE